MAAGFPHSFPAAVQAGGATASAEDAKNGLSMLPMMLHGIPHPHGAAIPQHALFSVSAMMAHAPPPPPHPSSTSSSSSSSSSSTLSTAKVTTTTTSSTSEAASPSSTTPAERESSTSSGSAGGEKERSREEKGAADTSKRAGGAETAAIITSTSRAQFTSAHLGGGGGSHLTFNPFLIPSMSHGLLYPHMFLPHGGIMALPAMPPGAVDSSPGSPKRRRKRGREEGEREEEREKPERESTVKVSVSSSSPSLPSTSGLPPTEEPLAGQGDAEEGPAEPQEPDSHQHPEGAPTEEKEGRSGDTGGEATGEEKQDAEEQRQEEGGEA